jgi:hypothetical protein
MSDLQLKIVKAALVLALCAGIVFAIVKGYELWRGHVFQQGDVAGAAREINLRNKDTIARAASAAKAISDARADERKTAAQAMETEREARRNAEKLAQLAQAAAARSAAVAGGMSRNIAALDAAAIGSGLPTAAACPGQFVEQRDAAIRARALLGSCVAEYRQLGEDADGAVDAIALRLDTALRYIAIVGPKP